VSDGRIKKYLLAAVIIKNLLKSKGSHGNESNKSF